MSRELGVHEPSPEFRAHLEWEISRGFRGRARQPSPATGHERWHHLGTIALVVAALATGFAGSVLRAQVQDTRRRQVLLAAEQADERLAAQRLQIAQAMMADAQRRFDAGIVGKEELQRAQAELEAMESNLARVRLNLEEISETAEPPRDDLTAPTVDDRDYVTARLELELRAAQQRLSAAELAAAEVDKRHRLGIVEEGAALTARNEEAQARAELELLIGKSELRQQYLQQSIQPAEVNRQLRRLELTEQLKTAQERQQLAEARLKTMNERRQAGIVQQVDVLRAQLELSEVRAQLEKIRANLQLLERQDL